METRTISSYTQCMPSSDIYCRSYFPSTFAFHGDKNYFLLHTVHAFLWYITAISSVHAFHEEETWYRPQTFLHHSTTVPSECSRVTISSIMHSCITGTISPPQDLFLPHPILLYKTIPSYINSFSSGTIFLSAFISPLEELFLLANVQAFLQRNYLLTQIFLPPQKLFPPQIHSANKRTIYFLLRAFLLQRNSRLTNIAPHRNYFLHHSFSTKRTISSYIHSATKQVYISP